MNNYWETNYKADQEGPTLFRYALRPHAGPCDPVDAARFGIERSRPLVVAPAHNDAPAVVPSRLRVEPNDVVVSAFKPSRDGKAMIVRLFGASGSPTRVNLEWSDPQPSRVWLSDLAERELSEMAGPVQVPAFSLVTLRAESALAER
jgi:alpha-mannosidase